MENIKLSQWSSQFLKDVDTHLAVNGDLLDLGYVKGSYMFLASEQGHKILKSNCETQR